MASAIHSFFIIVLHSYKEHPIDGGIFYFCYSVLYATSMLLLLALLDIVSTEARKNVYSGSCLLQILLIYN